MVLFIYSKLVLSKQFFVAKIDMEAGTGGGRVRREGISIGTTIRGRQSNAQRKWHD